MTTVSFYILQNFLIRTLAFTPTRPLYLTRSEEKVVENLELYEPDALQIPPIHVTEKFTSIPDNIDVKNQPSSSLSSVVDLEPVDGYPLGVPSNRRPVFQSANPKRNCHIIKCPKFTHATFGTDFKKCYEFLNPCYLAVASCVRYNAQLPRLKVVEKSQCHNLES
ncbi:uncharacterized protein LOC133837955 [Drosophila sulfurigaster albostrigata]|uniref:uncharacterized protein LOC133837955 n=1 Tax=Drosophila sulfurigaster albostrigata TaxID=89887 RepID=UPI002D21925F|nr:uncharacterized protein LOC133837955 [Drosophila sulfurigaster albostrigata]XP_062124855.1 uncharacterized protein LOC133837955 [Drosophila sulfurigaster albostrigata]